MLPTFIVIGARKSGTSSLWRYMASHPEVFVPAEEKEPKYFVEERGWTLGREWYEELFADAGQARARGEFSTDYSVFPLYAGVPKRMAALVPDAKLIYLMRDPIEHMRSAYEYSLWLGTEARPIRDALLLDARYLYECSYALQIAQYLTCFPLAQMLLLTAEDLRRHRKDTLRSIFSFVGVDAEWTPTNLDEEFNSASGRTIPRPWARKAGDMIIRSRLAQHIPARVSDRVESASQGPMFRRRILPAEVAIDDDLRQRLVGFLRWDLEQLRQWMGPTFHCWGYLD